MTNGQIWNDFDKAVLLPAIFENLSTIFPEYEFKKSGDEWHSFWDLNHTEKTMREDRTICKKEKYNFFNHQESRNIIKRYQEMHGLYSFMAARIELCKLAGVEMPEMTKEEKAKLQKKIERGKKSKTIQEKLYNALFSPSGQYALEYLHGRGFTDAIIKEGQKKGGFGFATKEIINEMGEYENQQYQTDEITGERYFRMKKENRVTIAFLYNSAFYYKFRSPRHGQEYENLFNFAARKYNAENGQGNWEKLTANEQRIYIDRNIELRHIAGDLYPAKHLFNFQNLRFTENQKEIILVEGEFDALAIRDIGGINNVCAIQGKDIREEQITDIFESPANAVCLCLDNDKAGREGAERVAFKILDAKKKYPTKQMRIFFLYLPEDYKDAGDYFKDKKNSGETFKEIGKSGFASYFLDKYKKEYEQKCTNNPERQDEYLYNLWDKFIFLLGCVDAFDRNSLMNDFSIYTGNVINDAVINEYQNNILRARAKEEQKKELIKATEQLKFAAETNNKSEIAEITKKIVEIQKRGDETKYELIWKPRTRASRLLSHKAHPQNIETDFYFGYGEERINGELAADALTIIAAKTGHGKTRMLINLALQFAYKNKETEGIILYFTLEQNADRIEDMMLNTYIGIDLNKREKHTSNINCIKDYFERETKQERFKYMSENVISDFEGLANEFGECYLDIDGSEHIKIKIINDSPDITEICNTIESAHKNAKGGVKAVFIDYIQRLHDEKHLTAQRTIELKIIAEQLNAVANKLCIPIIAGSQIRREVRNIGDFNPEQMSDSSDIEKSADTIWMLWDSSKPENGTHDKSIDLKGKGFGERGKLYVEIVKSRNSITGIYEILEMQPSTGRIYPSEYRERISDKIPREMFGRDIKEKSTDCAF